MKRLVVTGDDFGSSAVVNSAVADAHQCGVLTSASLMVAGHAWREAVVIARDLPTLAVGLHLVLVDGRSVLEPFRVPHLVDETGRFPAKPLRCGIRYQFDRAARRELRSEIRAQLERFRSTGLPLSHVDGHHHMHMHPVVLSALADYALEFGIPAVRLPREELGTALELDPRRRAVKVLWSFVFELLRRHAEPRLRAADIGHADRVYGLLATGKITERYLLSLIPLMQGERVELYTHPSRDLRGGGAQELAALLSRRVRETLDEHGFELGSPSSFRHREAPPEGPAAARSGRVS